MTIAPNKIARARKLWRRLWRGIRRKHQILTAVSLPDAQESMLLDRARCDAFREAIRRTVKPGDVVVDLGAGTGLLSFFAAQAGARRVYAIEANAIADVAAELIEVNGFRERITLIRNNSMKVRLPERCDVLISEILSVFCFDEENAIEFIADARERFLKPGGRIIPQAADTFVMPFSSEVFGLGGLVAGVPGEEPSFYGLDYRPLTKRLNECRVVTASGKPLLALSQPGHCYSVDFRKDRQNPGKTFVPFRLACDGRIDGFLGWFEAQLCDGVGLSNSPFLPPTTWGQLYLPVLEQPQCHAGQTLLLCLDPDMVAGDAWWSYAVQTADSDK